MHISNDIEETKQLLKSLIGNVNKSNIDYIKLIKKQNELIDRIYIEYSETNNKLEKTTKELSEVKSLLSDILINNYKKKINEIDSCMPSAIEISRSRIETREDLFEKSQSRPMTTKFFNSSFVTNAKNTSNGIFQTPQVRKREDLNSLSLSKYVNVSKSSLHSQNMNEKIKLSSTQLPMETINELFDSEYDKLNVLKTKEILNDKDVYIKKRRCNSQNYKKL